MNRAYYSQRIGRGPLANPTIEDLARALTLLIDAILPTKDPDIAKRVSGAVALYRHRGRTEEDLRLAVRELFDALEKLRPELKAGMLSKDEACR